MTAKVERPRWPSHDCGYPPSIRVVLNAINIVGAMSFVSTPNADLARDGLAGAGGAVQGYGRSATSPEAAD